MADRDETERGDPSREAGGGRRRVRFTRKWFLVGLGGAAATVVGIERLAHGLGGAPSGSTGRSTADLNPVDDFPVRTVDEVPRIKLADWVIKVDGLVERPLKIDATAWAALPRFEETVDFNCVEGWSVGPVTWGGVRPSDLIDLAGPLKKATHAVFHAFDGQYTDSLSLEQLRERSTILADSLDKTALPPDHGGPVRLIVPTQLAYKSVKFVRRVEVTDGPVQGYWEQRGYSVDAPVTR
jgi:DMSO/TMAO reductase YedYZ molybdopterin-dependent catalytic subunit